MPRRPKKRSSLKPPYLKWRDGRPRWEPGPTVRAKGWVGRDLKDEADNWLGLEAAIEAAKALNAEVAGHPRAPRRTPTKTTRTCRALYEAYIASPDFKRKKPSTQADYRSKAQLWLSDGFGDEPVAAITKAHMVGWWEQAYARRGHTMANGILAVARLMLSYGELRGWRPDGSNPALKLKRPRVDPRTVIWLPREPEHSVAIADSIGLPSIGDAIVLGLHTGQRLSDVLAFKDPHTDADRADFVQGKTGAHVSVPYTDQLAARIETMRRRRRRGQVASLKIDGPLIVRDDTGTPYDRHSFNKAFRLVREAAAKEMPEIAERTYRDLRDTAVTRLALADCSVIQICSITGHEFQTVHQILRHYVKLDPKMADAAIAKLKTYMVAEGIAL